MNKTAIKNYAIWARVQLIEAAKQRAYEYEITENGENKSGQDMIGGRLLTKTEKEQRNQLISEINRKGYSQVMEEAAYTWFNRFIALRFMEVNGYLPSKVRVFTDENGTFKPEILKQAISVELEGLDRSKVLDLLDKQDNEELYKYLLITQCNALNAGLPYMFEKISNWTELLFPANLLRSDSVIGKLISDIAIEDWDNEVEIIGWFYQYYISEKHEKVIDPLRGRAIKKEDIPAATQLFTTDWVVRYIVDNSLGRYWIERHPESRLAEKLTYFVTPKDGVIPTVNESILPEELKVFDPCVGSGHFLSYAFDIFLEIYRECGWSDRDAAKSILDNNLYGLDIDDRAAQLACFAVMMKARKNNRRIISADTKLHILAMQDSTSITEELIKYVSKQDGSIKKDLNEIRLLFNNAKEYGSIINVPKFDFGSLYTRIDEVETEYTGDLMEMALQRETVELLLPLINQAEILAGKYDIVATNPPYMNRYSPRLKSFIEERYADYKGDLFSVFMFRNLNFCKENGYSGFMTPNVWMYIKSFEKLRSTYINQKSITSFLLLAKGAFYKEATVDLCCFVVSNTKGLEGSFIRLEQYKGDMEKQKDALLNMEQLKEDGNIFYRHMGNFSLIPGNPLAFWISDSLLSTFKQKSIDSITISKAGIVSGNDALFLRVWYEIAFSNITMNAENFDDPQAYKWVPINKGGAFRRYYGNHEYIINIFDIWNSPDKVNESVRRSEPGFYFKKAMTWSYVTTGKSSFRYTNNKTSATAAPNLFFNSDEELFYTLAFTNCCIAQNYLDLLNPTINLNVTNVSTLPIIFNEENKTIIVAICKKNIEYCKKDWDSFETSWDFKKHPLV